MSAIHVGPWIEQQSLVIICKLRTSAYMCIKSINITNVADRHTNWDIIFKKRSQQEKHLWPYEWQIYILRDRFIAHDKPHYHRKQPKGRGHKW